MAWQHDILELMKVSEALCEFYLLLYIFLLILTFKFILMYFIWFYWSANNSALRLESDTGSNKSINIYIYIFLFIYLFLFLIYSFIYAFYYRTYRERGREKRWGHNIMTEQFYVLSVLNVCNPAHPSIPDHFRHVLLHRFSLIFFDYHWASFILIDLNWFQWFTFVQKSAQTALKPNRLKGEHLIAKSLININCIYSAWKLAILELTKELQVSFIFVNVYCFFNDFNICFHCFAFVFLAVN